MTDPQPHTGAPPPAPAAAAAFPPDSGRGGTNPHARAPKRDWSNCPACGLVAGLLLSVPLWCVIILTWWALS